MELLLDTKSVSSYRRFLEIKNLPSWSMRGRLATFPDEYANRLGIAVNSGSGTGYEPESFLFDYQKDITRTAIERQKFAVFADCGLGKSLIILSYANYVRQHIGKKRVLIITPPLVVPQLAGESERFYGSTMPVEILKAKQLQQWLEAEGGAVGITNYEALKKETTQGNLGALILDESSILKSHYGNYAGLCLKLGSGLDWKLCCTGTPAPNDRIEYANHATFLDRFPTVNSFLAKYFVNRGQTGERWELKPHALRPFYRSLSDWCIFLTDPSVYGWKDNTDTIPPINVHIHEVPLTQDQRDWVQAELGTLVAIRTGGITHRSAYGQVSKGFWKGKHFATNKYDYIQNLVADWADKESTLVWALYDEEQRRCHEVLGGDSMSGKTPVNQRMTMIDRFRTGECRVLTSKPRILGFGLNLQKATRQVFSGLQDSYEAYYQCVKRSNRIGSTKPLNVHIPVTELEEPMVENVLRKSARVEHDTKEQELLFKEVGCG